MGSAGELPPDRPTIVRKSGSYRRMTSDHVHIDVGDGGSELSRNRSYRSGSRGFTAPTDWMANVGSGENLMAVDNVFSRQSSVSSAQGDEEALHWAALEKLPTFDRLRTAVHSALCRAPHRELLGSPVVDGPSAPSLDFLQN
ncbi:unnamed protein product [Calypogeia fissa]